MRAPVSFATPDGRVAGVILLVIVALATDAPAVIRRVPAEYPTIQEALSDCVNDDSVLVAPGLYAEVLTIPLVRLHLLGDVVPDSVDYPRPVIDPSSLNNPQNLRCMYVGSSEFTCEDFVFRNGPEMYPRDSWIIGGISNNGLLTMRRCLFDSVNVGIRSFYNDVVLQECVFTDCQFSCVHGTDAVIATDCEFSGRCEESLVWARAHSRFTRCHFHDNLSYFHLLRAFEEDVLVEDCIFGPSRTFAGQQVVDGRGLVGSRFERNVFTDLECSGSAITLYSVCDSSFVVRDNIFQNITSVGQTGAKALLVTCEVCDLCFSGTVENNVFDNIIGASHPKALWLNNPVTVFHNRFVNLQPDSTPAVKVRSAGSVFQDNLFSSTGIAILTDYSLEWGFTVEADSNWWGHSTGPYHPLLNPLGQGDEVGDSVHFSPWHTDTTFWHDYNSSPRRDMRVPLSVDLSAYPNPFNSTTMFRLDVTQAAIVRLELFDLLGRRVTEIWSGAVPYRKEIPFQADNLPSGLYLARAFDPLHNRPLALAKVVLLR